LETFGGKLLLDSDLSTMAKQQNVIDATIDLIKGGKDASEVLKCCKGLVKDDLFLLIGLLSSLKTLKTIEEDKENVPPPVVENDSSQSQSPKVPGEATNAVIDTETANVTATEAAKKEVVEKRLQALVALRATKICRNMMETGLCDQNKNVKSCQYSHPKKCNHYATYGLAKTNPNGCRSAECKYLHVVICRYKTKDQCKKQVCFLQHLQPKPEKKVKPEVKPEVRKVDHQKTGPISVEPKQGPIAAVGVTTERSFLEQGQSQRLSRLEDMLEKVMMMLIPRQPRSFAQAASGWEHWRGASDKTS
jgi:hypothetical protein